MKVLKKISTAIVVATVAFFWLQSKSLADINDSTGTVHQSTCSINHAPVVNAGADQVVKSREP